MKRGHPAHLVLSDGSVFVGDSFGAATEVAGEVVFCTGLVGYPESLTDPSYRGQILVFTYPLIGNYGVPDRSRTAGILDNFESDRIQVSGVIVAVASATPSHWTSIANLHTWLEAEGVPAIEGVDTRRLTQILRSHGVMPGRIGQGAARRDPLPGPEDVRILETAVSAVSVDKPTLLQSPVEPPGGRRRTVALLDCGAKNNILRALLARGVDVLRLPWNVDFSTVDEGVAGLMISNGPGDPQTVGPSIAATRAALDRGMPTFGICFGNQILALAAGADTYKLPWGHRGQNQPCVDLDTGRCYITSQNHGYAVDEKTLPEGWEPWFRNANDTTNEGIRHRSKPFASVQFHPEADPGPEDVSFLIDDFLQSLR
ncbi:MAG: glutamine-hydrolyzing carbamoyl-phosphate synthase small subunit [Chloroflexota bacterium]